MKPSKILVPILQLGATCSSMGATTLFSDDFGTTAAASIAGWGGGTYSSTANTPAGLATQTASTVVLGGTNGVGQLDISFPSKTAYPNFFGAQLSRTLPTAIFDGYALSDITVTFDVAVMGSKAGGPYGINFEFRESGTPESNGATHRFNIAPVDNALTFQTYSFTLDQNTFGAFAAFGSGTKSMLFQLRDNWADSALDTTTTFQVDNVSITAVPEPSTVVIGGLSLGLTLLRRRR